MISSRFATWNAVAISLLLFVAFLWIDPTGRSSQFFRFLGRLHPVVVHLPIGIMLLALIFTVLNRLGWVKIGDNVINLTLFLGSWAGVKAILAGSWLAQTGGYPEDILFLHKVMGYGATSICAINLLLRTTDNSFLKKPIFTNFSWGLMTAWLIIGGDLGGKLTHGPGFVTEYAPEIVKSVLGHSDPMSGRFQLDTPGETTVFEGIVLPIFVNKCVFCHGETRGKGRLRLHSSEVIKAHEGDEPLIVKGRPEESLLIQRIALPEGHEDQMPPAMHAKPISHADVELLKWWVASGASFDATLSETDMPASIFSILKAYGLNEQRKGVFALDLPEPDSIAIRTGRELGLRIDVVAEGESVLSITCGSAPRCIQSILDAGLTSSVTWLDLRESSVQDEDLAALAEFVHLTRINLAGTGINGSGLTSLSGLEYLEYINLYDTSVDDAGINNLASIKSITAVYLWQTAVTEEGIARLKEALPDAEISLGDDN